jgi:tripeptide aminopeptidase
VNTTATLTTSALERFLRYVTYDTQSSEESESAPSTEKQLVLLDQLVKELKELGLADAQRGPQGVVMATLPATTKKTRVPVVGFMAHVDTSPEESGANVKPIVHRNWQGGDIVLPDDPSVVLRPSEIPALEQQIGHDVVTASGTTLLGADNKAGVAAIMAAIEHLARHPEIPHGAIRVAFTPDEEIGRGADHFDVAQFGAFCAYTMDGEGRGRVENETFSGDSMTVTFQGFNTHPGFAKGKMVNAIKAVADFIARLPEDRLSPETTSDREGFVHPYVLEGGVGAASVRFIVRDFDTPKLAEMEKMIERLAQETVAAHPGVQATCVVKESYRNMREVLDRHPEIVENAREAVRRAGLNPELKAIRGGTDGCRLSFMGLPTPNLFAGENNFHSKLEWVSAQDMDKSAETIVHLCRIWEEKAPA